MLHEVSPKSRTDKPIGQSASGVLSTVMELAASEEPKKNAFHDPEPAWAAGEQNEFAHPDAPRPPGRAGAGGCAGRGRGGAAGGAPGAGGGGGAGSRPSISFSARATAGP